MKSLLLSAALAAITATSAFAEDLKALEAYAFGSRPTAKAGAAYISVRNHGEPDRLVGAASDVAKRVEIHHHIDENGVMKMREIKDGVAIGNHEHIEMGPGGIHVMLMGLNGPLVLGEAFDVALTFESGTELVVSVPVVDRATYDAGEHSGHHGHKKHHGEGHGDDGHKPKHKHGE